MELFRAGWYNAPPKCCTIFSTNLEVLHSIIHQLYTALDHEQLRTFVAPAIKSWHDLIHTSTHGWHANMRMVGLLQEPCLHKQPRQQHTHRPILQFSQHTASYSAIATECRHRLHDFTPSQPRGSSHSTVDWDVTAQWISLTAQRTVSYKGTCTYLNVQIPGQVAC